jgi:processive 1,2-diacylglycerol beta-glucosyltransferase
MPIKKILLLSVSAGAGHMRAAEALRARVQIDRPDIEVVHYDTMDYVTAAFKKLYTDFYIKLVNKAPALWGYLYDQTNEAKSDSVMEQLRRKLERMNARALREAIAEFNPDAIICTHFLPAEMLSRLLRKDVLHCPVWVQVTDFDLHRLWVHEGIAGYFVANDEVAFRLRAHGIAENRIHATGIPIMPAFTETLDRARCAQAHGIDPMRKTMLLMGGGAGLGSLDAVASRLLAIDALTALRAIAKRYPNQLKPFGFTDQVEQLMACADVAITKPGGLTTSECLALGLPMILNSPIPGQEERNADYLLEQGVALKACDDVTLEYRVRKLLQQPEQLTDMRKRASAIGRAHAAQDALNIVLS